MHSPPVQPRPASASDAGAVMTMSLVIATILRESSGMLAAHALAAMTSRSAVSVARSGADHDGPAAAERSDASVLVDPHARFQRHAPQPPHQRRRLDGRRARLEHAGAVDARSRAARDLLRSQPAEGVDAELLAERNDALPRAHLGLRGRRPEPARLAKVSVDAVGLAEGPDLPDRRLRVAGHAEGVLRPAERDERGELRPPGKHEPAVTARGAAAADVLLEHDHVAGRLEPLDADRRPQPHVAAAENRDVGARAPFERRSVRRIARDFLQPERTVWQPGARWE